MTRDEAVFLWKKIQFLKKVASLQRQSPDLFGRGIDQRRHFTAGMRSDDVQERIGVHRKELRKLPRDKREALLLRTIHLVGMIVRGGTGRKVEVSLREVPSAHRYTRYGKVEYTIDVRWTWINKVCVPLYSGEHTYGTWFIVHAEKLKLNNKNIEIHEVLVFDTSKAGNELKKAYVSFPKQFPQLRTMHHMADKAVKSAEQSLLDQMDDLLLKGTEND